MWVPERLHNFGNVTLDYNIAYTWAKQEKPQEVDPTFATG